jgi:hypothetical protein
MKSIIIAPIFAVIVILALQGAALAEPPSPESYCKRELAPGVIEQTDFVGSYADFAKVAEKCRQAAIVGLISGVDDETGQDGKIIRNPDHNRIIQDYMPQFSPEDRRKIYMDAMEEIVTSNMPTVRQDRLQVVVGELMTNGKKSLTNGVCETIRRMGTGYSDDSVDIQEQNLKANKDKIERFTAALSQWPELSNDTCEFKNPKTGERRNYSLGQLIATASPDMYAKIRANLLGQQSYVAEVSRQYSSCSKDQIAKIAASIINQMKNYRSAWRSEVGIRQGNCMVMGTFRRVKDGSYRFLPRSATTWFPLEMQPYVFFSPEALGEMLTRDPKVYVLKDYAKIIPQKPAQGQTKASTSPESKTLNSRASVPVDETKGSKEAFWQFIKGVTGAQ